MKTLLSEDWAIRYARESALAFGAAGAQRYLPTTPSQAANWLPHWWVVEAIRTAFGHGLRGRADTGFLILPKPPAPETYASNDADLLKQARSVIAGRLEHCAYLSPSEKAVVDAIDQRLNLIPSQGTSP